MSEQVDIIEELFYRPGQDPTNINGRAAGAIKNLRAYVAELKAETEVWRTSNAALTSECLTLRARVAELEAGGPGTIKHRLNAVCDYAVESCGHNPLSARPPELAIYDRITNLVALLIEVVHCGGQCSAELLAKIERATPEAGWTDVKEVMPNQSDASRLHAGQEQHIGHPSDNAQPRPAHPDPSTSAQDLSKGPAGAFYCSDYGFMVIKVCDTCDCQHGPKHAFASWMRP